MALQYTTLNEINPELDGRLWITFSKNSIALRLYLFIIKSVNVSGNAKQGDIMVTIMEVDYKKTVAQVREEMQEDGIDDSEFTDEQLQRMIDEGF